MLLLGLRVYGVSRNIPQQGRAVSGLTLRTCRHEQERACPPEVTLLLGGSWVIRRVTIRIPHINGRVTPLITTHEPPSTTCTHESAQRGATPESTKVQPCHKEFRVLGCFSRKITIEVFLHPVHKV